MRLDRYRHPNLSRSEIVFVNKSRRRWCPGVPILGLQSREKAAMLGDQYNRIFSRRIYMKIEFSSQTREMLLFLTTNMAAMTSRACKPAIHMVISNIMSLIRDVFCAVLIHFSKGPQLTWVTWWLSYWVTGPRSPFRECLNPGGGGGGYSHTLAIQVCAAQRGNDFEAPDLERGIHFRGVF